MNQSAIYVDFAITVQFVCVATKSFHQICHNFEPNVSSVDSVSHKLENNDDTHNIFGLQFKLKLIYLYLNKRTNLNKYGI